MKRLTFIISYRTTPEELEDSLLSILENRPDSCDIFVIKSKVYENPYDLNEDEVHFVEAPRDFALPNDSCWECFRLGLNLCDSDYVYLMPAGTHFQAGWSNAVTILEQNADLGAFFLDENLISGGFFRKSILKELIESQLKNISTEEPLSAASELECLNSLAVLLQENGWNCGLAEFEETECENLDSEAERKPAESETTPQNLDSEAERKPAESETTPQNLGSEAERKPAESETAPQNLEMETAYAVAESASSVASFPKSEFNSPATSNVSQHLQNNPPTEESDDFLPPFSSAEEAGENAQSESVVASSVASSVFSAGFEETYAQSDAENGIVKRIRSLCRKLFVRSPKQETKSLD